MKKMVAIVLVVSLVLLFPPAAFAGQLDELQEVLEHLRATTFWVENYEFDYWDCSNMSGALEVLLEEEGFDAYIVTGKFEREEVGHAFVAVFNEEKDKCLAIVESTFLCIIPPGLYHDFQTDHIFESWEEAYLWCPEEFYLPDPEEVLLRPAGCR